jgi:hypothetical protein
MSMSQVQQQQQQQQQQHFLKSEKSDPFVIFLAVV